jgi:predicted O-methyltransferase YrrM
MGSCGSGGTSTCRKGWEAIGTPISTKNPQSLFRKLPLEAMEQTIRNFLRQLQESGKLHDELEPEHAKKLLNLEPETAETVALLLKIAGVRNLLEIGTSNGYSTIWIAATVGPVGGRIVTIERNAEKHRQAADNLARLRLSQFVDLRLGDATEIVASLSGPFDCVFFDADRVSASQQLDLLVPKLSRKALLLADNAVSHPEQIHDYLTSVARLDHITHLVLHLGKGLSVAFRDLDRRD